ncbi:site-specific integrase [Streptococcus sanguinis]|jgi:integrase/recombinase|uniref:site-specific integrase n=1 Tax=Streptococcus sanguinis TaxID=1305 RepID=UPI001374DE2A|nr:site-specific integrase [Streptococcus sanguinis]KAF1306610.1 Integrase [Streptococcus sanguinis OH0843]
MASVRYLKRGKKNLWTYTIRDETSKTIAYKSGFDTKKKAQIEAEKLLRKLNHGFSLDNKMSLYQLYQEWLNLKILPSKRSQTTKNKYIMRKEIIKKLFGDTPVSQIKPSNYQRIMNDYGKTVTRDTLSRLHTSIKECIKTAQADKIFIEDFTFFAELFSSKESQSAEEKYIHSEKDLNNIIKYIKQKMDYRKSAVPFIIYFLFKTGMRFGELVALTWEDINFDEKVIKTYRRYNTSTRQFVPPKNQTSIRNIPISDEEMNILKALKQEQVRLNNELRIININNFIFQHYGYVQDIPNNATVNKELRKILIRLDILPIITTKGARHTYGSFLWHNQIDLGVIARILGHKDISMLVEVYGHTLQEKINDEFDNVRKLL